MTSLEVIDSMPRSAGVSVRAEPQATGGDPGEPWLVARVWPGARGGVRFLLSALAKLGADLAGCSEVGGWRYQDDLGGTPERTSMSLDGASYHSPLSAA
jgi:hypothetical protein